MSGWRTWLTALAAIASLPSMAAFLVVQAGPGGTASAPPHAAQAAGPAPRQVMTQARSFAGTPAVGALVTLTAAGEFGTHFCSASVLDSPAGNLIITAAHCLPGRQAGQFAFVPGYDSGRAPYVVWPVRPRSARTSSRSTRQPSPARSFRGPLTGRERIILVSVTTWPAVMPD